MPVRLPVSFFPKPATPRGQRPRLTGRELIERDVTGGELQAGIEQLAEMLGWWWVHFRPAKTKKGWRTPVEGPLGEGWPDLFLAHPINRRILAIECKREIDDPVTPAQELVHSVFEASGIRIYTARPSSLREPIQTSEVYRWLTR
jgi:hypothetical protein